MEFSHTPVLLKEVLDGLCIKPDGIYVDGTLGGAGHSFEIVKRLSPVGKLIGIDQDGDAIEAATQKLRPYERQVTLVRDNYENIALVLKEEGICLVDGILLDLGVSSYQLDDPERGFSYRFNAPLDMRMDCRQSLTAKEIINTWTEKELALILREYGEERFATRIAGKIVKVRTQKPIETTFELNEIIESSIPMKMRIKGGHPSKRTFQAIRIACNRELEVLSEALDAMIERLDDGGRICVITFHSLEDRIVKSAFRKNENPCTCPPEFPVCVCGKISKGRVVTTKPILPSEGEKESNPRAKSAKLRIFERQMRKK